jgi:hypothetical protein
LAVRYCFEILDWSEFRGNPMFLLLDLLRWSGVPPLSSDGSENKQRTQMHFRSLLLSVRASTFIPVRPRWLAEVLYLCTNLGATA